MREVFGGITGERWWRMIRGQSVAMPPVKRWQIGHSNVLAPEYRNRVGAWSIACRLLEKAAERLRFEGFHAQRLQVSVCSYEGEEWTRQVKFRPCNHTATLLDALVGVWQDDIARPAQVKVALQDILQNDAVTPDLFDDPEQIALDAAADRINRLFGRGTVTVASALRSKAYLDHARIPFGKPSAIY